MTDSFRFLLARFHVSRIVAGICPRDVRKILASLSGNLPDVYGFCLRQLRCQHPKKWQLAKRALSWISEARRPLTDLELTHALSFQLGDSHMEPAYLVNMSMIVAVCDGMLRLEPPVHRNGTQQSTVSFTHSTIAEFMRQITERSNVHGDIANTSLGYLATDRTATESCPRGHHFLSYAMNYWGYHASKSREQFNINLLVHYASKCPSAIAETSMVGLDLALQVLLDRGFSANSSHNGMTLLMLLAYHGHPQCVLTLLNAGTDVNYVSKTAEPYNTALSCAAAEGHRESVCLMINAGADLNAGCTPPILAACNAGHCHIVEQLLRSGCNVNIKHGTKLRYTRP